MVKGLFSFIRYLLSTYYVSSLFSTGNRVLNKIDKNPCSTGTYIQWNRIKLFAIFCGPRKAISFISNLLRFWGECFTTIFYIMCKKLTIYWYKTFFWLKRSYFSLRKVYVTNLCFRWKSFFPYISLIKSVVITRSKSFWAATYLLIDISTLETGNL